MHPQTYLALNRSGYWAIRWTERDANGISRSKSFSTETRDKNVAERIKVQYDKELAAEVEVFADPTVAMVIEAYLRAGGPKGRLHASNRRIFDRFLRGKLAGLRPSELSGRPIREWREQRSREVKAATVLRELSALRGALNWAAHPDLPGAGLIEPGAVPRLKLPKADPVEKQFLDEASEGQFLDLALAYRRRVGLYVAVGLGTGARREALHDLTWNRVDMVKRVIDFRVPGRPEEKKARVPVPIDDRLFGVLDTVPESERWGPVIGSGDIRTGFETFVKTTPWPWVTSHIMRHTYITLALRAGVSIWEVAQLVGDTVATIEKHYGHHAADWKLHEAANRRFRK